MEVKLISYSQPSKEFLKETGMESLEDLVSYAARVSNPTNQINKETAPKLIKYLIDHKHWSPLEMVSLTVEIKTTRDIGRQILRHRSFSFQEFSQRYADPTSMKFEHREARLQDTKNRQNSISVNDHALQEWWDSAQERVKRLAESTYTTALDHGMAKEQARAILPEGMTPSVMYMSGTLRSFWHYIQLRARNGTQKEHMDIALACMEAIAEVFPMIRNCLED